MMILKRIIRICNFYKLKAKKKLSDALTKGLEALVKQLILKHPSIIQTFTLYRFAENQQKQQRLNRLNGDQKTVFFIFRDLHILDWFTPIDRALSAEYGNKYPIIYIDFGSTVSQIGMGFRYLAYRGEIEKRLLDSGISKFLHFSDQEIDLFENFPQAHMIITSENIRHEHFTCEERVYLPHYSIPKAKDLAPRNISYNHLFLPSRPPFCYNEFLENIIIPAKIHNVGYPKMHTLPQRAINLFDSYAPVVIFAPSVEVEIIMNALQKGILQIFKRMDDINFIIKLHPTLSTGMHGLSWHVKSEIENAPNILLDTRNSIQNIGMNSSALIGDFGSVGAEYRLSFGKRLIYIDVPDFLSGGADLRFRDAFADGRSNVNNLEKVIRTVLKMGDLSQKEWQEMCEKTLFSYGFADRAAAQTIDQILFS